MIYFYFKRGLDILLSGLALLLLMPLLVPILVILRLTAEGEVFYFQDRIGYKNQTFQIWKFATMLKDSPNMGSGDVTLRNDPRVTLIGKPLRMTKVNELPQLINILKGDMSIVGPRPLMKNGFDRYSDFYKERVYLVKPGLTGIGSIVFRDEEAIFTNSHLSPHECYAQIILPHKGALEVWYQQHISFYTDVMIVFLTAWAILFPRSELAFKVFKDLPQQPEEMKQALGA